MSLGRDNFLAWCPFYKFYMILRSSDKFCCGPKGDKFKYIVLFE